MTAGYTHIYTLVGFLPEETRETLTSSYKFDWSHADALRV